MNKISIFFLVIGFIICDDNDNDLRKIIDTLGTEPYHHFDWLDEDDYTITIKYASDSKPTQCCLWNGTHFCRGEECKVSESEPNTVSCKFTGASCGADSDNPATKYYYALYCDNSACTSKETATASDGLDDSKSVDVTVAVSRESYIRYYMVLLLSLLVL